MRGQFTVTVEVPVKLLASISQSSCGNGTRPAVVRGLKSENHFVASEKLTAPDVCLKYCFCAVVNVIPELPPQSPEPPVILAKFQDALPAPVISLKSTLLAVIVPLQVMVRGVPMVFEATKMR